MAKILITGGVGFIGYHLALALNSDGHQIWLLDNFNLWDSVKGIKRDRKNLLTEVDGIDFMRMDIRSQDEIWPWFEAHQFDTAVHLAGHGMIRTSAEAGNKLPYVMTGIAGVTELIEMFERFGVNNVFYASTGEVGQGNALPWSESVPIQPALNHYTLSKIANEMQFNMSDIQKTVGLRLFNTYGPYGRIDMAPTKFATCLQDNLPIQVHNEGNMSRDWIYIDDAINGIKTIMNHTWNTDGQVREIYNIGSGTKTSLNDFITKLETAYGVTGTKELVDMASGEVQDTQADITKLQALGWSPTTSLDDGLTSFVTWFKTYYGVS